MTPDDFTFLSTFLKTTSGLVLGSEKDYLVEGRLKPVAVLLGLQDVAQLVAKLREGNNEKVRQTVIEAMTTNETFFFRDVHPFETFRTVILPELLERRRNRRELRIWCAAASSGQEPYSLAMLLREETAKLTGWKIEIIATDLDQAILKTAEEGIYRDFDVQRGLPARMLVKYFERRPDRNWALKPEIRNMVKFRQQNLLGSFSHLGLFDVVLCRNVLIYFDVARKRDILDRIARLLPSDGYLMLGGAETVIKVSDRFGVIAGQRGLYRTITEPPARVIAPAASQRLAAAHP